MQRSMESAVRRGRTLYIWQAAAEYLISILVTGSFLATLTGALGFSDSLTGVLSSVIALGCLFQLPSIALRRTRVKRLVIAFSVLNQILFLSLYLLPLTGLPQEVKIALFVVCILSAYVLYNLVSPKKTIWLMSLVEDGQRGTFTANKEIVSLIVGMTFSYLMGAVADHFSAAGQLTTAFGISAAVMAALMLTNTVLMASTVEKEVEQPARQPLRQVAADVIRSRDIRRIVVVFILYKVAHYASIPFYGTYMIHELEFNLRLVSALTVCSSVVRIAVSRFWGRYADRKSFSVMMEKCMALLGLAFLMAVMAVPQNGKVMFVLYYVFHGAAMGGINSALTNMVFDYVPQPRRSDSLAVCQALSGTVGFLTTLFVSPLVARIQANGNLLLGFPVYAQQVLSLFSALLAVAAIVYLRLVVMKKR